MNHPEKIYVSGRYAMQPTDCIRVNGRSVSASEHDGCQEYIRGDLVEKLVEALADAVDLLESYNCSTLEHRSALEQYRKGV